MEGVRSKTFEYGGKKLRLVECTPAMREHWCEKGHIDNVLEGRFEADGSEELPQQ